MGDSKLEVPLSGVGSSSGKVSNSEPSLLAARALRGLIDKEKQHHIFYENKCYLWGARFALCHWLILSVFISGRVCACVGGYCRKKSSLSKWLEIYLERISRPQILDVHNNTTW